MNYSPTEKPVTLLVTREPRAGKQAMFEERLRQTIEAAITSPGHLGVDIIRPVAPNREYRILVRFASEQKLDEWLDSKESTEWLGKLDALQDKPARYQRETGLERWFVDESKAGPGCITPPPRHKMALLSMLGAFPTIVVLLYLLQPLLGEAHLIFRAAVLVPLMVSALTYVIMPQLSQWFAVWLKPAD